MGQQGADTVFLDICVLTCLEKTGLFVEIDNKTVNPRSVINTHMVIKLGMRMAILIPVR